MASQIIDADDNEVAFDVDAQRYKDGRFTMPAAVLRHLRLEWNEHVHLRIASLEGTPRWTGVLKMQSGPEIDNSLLVPQIRRGERIRVVASRA